MAYIFRVNIPNQKAKLLAIALVMMLAIILFVYWNDKNRQSFSKKQSSFYSTTEYSAYVVGNVVRTNLKYTGFLREHQFIRKIDDEDRVEEEKEIAQYNTGIAGNPDKAI